MLSVTSVHIDEDGKQHDHVVFFTEVSPGLYEGETSFDAGHSHKITAFTDPQTGKVTIIASGEEVGHEHTVANEYPHKKVKRKKFAQKTQGVRIAEILDLFTNLRDLNKDNYDNAQENEEFVRGKQWTEREQEYLDRQERACLVINKTETYVDELCGYGAEDDTDFQYQPKDEGKQEIADLLNIVKRHVENKNDFKRRVRNKIFFDLVVPGTSNLHFRMDYSQDVYGELILERFPWNKVLYAEHEDDYGRDCPAAIKWKRVTRDYALNRYPEAKAKIKEDFKLVDQDELLSSVESVEEGTDYPLYGGNYGAINREHLNIAYADKEVLVLEVYRQSFHEAPILVDMYDGKRYDGYGWRKKDLKRFRDSEFPFSSVIERSCPKIRKTVVVGGFIVEDVDPAPIPGNVIPIVPVYAKRVNGIFWSKVSSAKDPQIELNKRKSQGVDLTNSNVGGTWFYDDTTFNGEERLKQEFIDNIAMPNAAIEIADMANRPYREPPTQIPPAVLQGAKDADDTLREVFNIKVQVTGSHQSQAHLLEQKRTMLIGNNFLFDAMDGLLRRYSELLLYWIQTYFEPEQIARIVQADKREEATIQGQPASSFTSEQIMSLLENEDLTRYDIDIIPGKYKESFRLATLDMLLGIQQAGGHVPYATLLEYRGLPAAERDKMLQQYQQLQQQQAQQEQAKNDVEIDKTMAAHGNVSPKIKERYEREQKEYDQKRRAEIAQLQQERRQNSVGSNGIPQS